MTGPGRRFDPAELFPESGAAPSDAEMADALAAARELESLSVRDQVGPTVGFEDRVMAAIAVEAPPRLIVRPTRGGLIGRAAAVAGSVGAAWRVATSGGRPVLVRAQAFAFVLLIVLTTGSLAGVAAIGAANVLLPLTAPAPRAPVITTSPSPMPPVRPTQAPPSALPTPSQSPESSPEPSPSDEPGATDDRGSGPGDNAGPTETPETKTARPTRTPKPNETPRPTRTPRPTETPEPTETDDHGGGDDHSGSGGGGGDDGSGGGGVSGGGD